LINNGGHLASALHLEIDGATMVRKRVIDEPQNLNHNVVPKRAEIGQITVHIAPTADADVLPENGPFRDLAPSRQSGLLLPDRAAHQKAGRRAASEVARLFPLIVLKAKKHQGQETAKKRPRNKRSGAVAKAAASLYTNSAKEHSAMKENEMLLLKRITWFAAFLGAHVVSASSAHAADIGGTISSTLTITEDSQLVDDVTCTVTGAPCIAIGAPNVTLELNGFTMTGQGDPQTGCAGAGTANEFGIIVGQTGVTIHGPGLVQQFRNQGIILNNSTRSRVIGVTTSTNCFSGIFVAGGSENELYGNISVRNGNLTNPCGGI
jgi:hypothetical protein